MTFSLEMIHLWSALLLSLIIGASAPASAKTNALTGKVVGVKDGDSIVVLDSGGRSIDVRLAGIDAPEKGQAYGNAAKLKLSELVFTKDVRVEYSKKDRYDRILGKVWRGSLDVNTELIRSGYAWLYRYYAGELSELDRVKYEKAEALAKISRSGLWKDNNPVPPWEFRHKPAEQPGLTPPQAVPVGPIIGNMQSRVFHRPDCPNYRDVSPGNQIRFSTTTEAVQAGYRQARNCPPIAND